MSKVVDDVDDGKWTTFPSLPFIDLVVGYGRMQIVPSDDKSTQWVIELNSIDWDEHSLLSSISTFENVKTELICASLIRLICLRPSGLLFHQFHCLLICVTLTHSFIHSHSISTVPV